MSEPFSLDDFNGVARLFPLPNLVMFPGVIQPLHVFEARYREMMVDALEDDRLLTIVLLQPGYEEDYYEKPLIHGVGCIGRIFKEERLEDGRYNLLLHGAHRALIEKELTTDKLYRTADVQLLQDIPVANESLEHALREKMEEKVTQWFMAHSGTDSHARSLLQSDLPLSTLCDIFSFALPLETMVKQQLLEELNVEQRVELLLFHVEENAPEEEEPTPRKFPPDFSSN